MGHILFCNRLIGDKNQRNHCTRMICFDHGHAKTLSKLNSMPISSFLVYAPQRTINAFKMSLPDIENSIISLNWFIGRSSLNNSMIKNGQKNFYDINPLSANHPILTFLNLMIVSSRIAVNYLYKRMEYVSSYVTFPTYMPIDRSHIELIVYTIRLVCTQYLKHFSYDGFIEMFDKISVDEFSGSFRLIYIIEEDSSEDEQ